MRMDKEWVEWQHAVVYWGEQRLNSLVGKTVLYRPPHNAKAYGFPSEPIIGRVVVPTVIGAVWDKKYGPWNPVTQLGYGLYERGPFNSYKYENTVTVPVACLRPVEGGEE